jgi:hypothetical protein
MKPRYHVRLTEADNKVAFMHEACCDVAHASDTDDTRQGCQEPKVVILYDGGFFSLVHDVPDMPKGHLVAYPCKASQTLLSEMRGRDREAAAATATSKAVKAPVKNGEGSGLVYDSPKQVLRKHMNAISNERKKNMLRPGSGYDGGKSAFDFASVAHSSGGQKYMPLHQRYEAGSDFPSDIGDQLAYIISKRARTTQPAFSESPAYSPAMPSYSHAAPYHPQSGPSYSQQTPAYLQPTPYRAVSSKLPNPEVLEEGAATPASLMSTRAIEVQARQLAASTAECAAKFSAIVPREDQAWTSGEHPASNLSNPDEVTQDSGALKSKRAAALRAKEQIAAEIKAHRDARIADIRRLRDANAKAIEEKKINLAEEKVQREQDTKAAQIKAHRDARMADILLLRDATAKIKLAKERVELAEQDTKTAQVKAHRDTTMAEILRLRDDNAKAVEEKIKLVKEKVELTEQDTKTQEREMPSRTDSPGSVETPAIQHTNVKRAKYSPTGKTYFMFDNTESPQTFNDPKVTVADELADETEDREWEVVDKTDGGEASGEVKKSGGIFGWLWK